MDSRIQFRRFARWVVPVLLLSLIGTASAAIIRIEAEVSAGVRERIDGVPGSFSEDSEVLLPGDVDGFVDALGFLESTDLEGTRVSLGESISEFSDPTNSQDPNPREFGLEVACFSNNDSISYLIESTGIETRTIVFTTPGNDLAEPEIEFDRNLRRVVRSTLFLSGAVVAWSTDKGRDLTNLLGEVQIEVTREGDETPLFHAALAVNGDANGRLAPDATGPLRFSPVSLEELAELGLDPGALDRFDEAAGTGSLLVLAIRLDENNLAYEYEVAANEPFRLIATLQARARNLPAGTGVAAVLGKPFRRLGELVENALPGVNGETFQRSINAAVTPGTAGLGGAAGTPPKSRALCGALGSGAPMMLALGLFMMFARARRRRA